MKLSLKDRIDLVKNIDNSNTRINELVKIKDEIKDIKIVDYETYFMVIDILMLLGIEYYLIKNNNEAKYNTYSKENYYDIINCAYSWLVYYSFEDKDYKTTEKYCRKVLDNYLEVKDDPKYFVTEKESVDICNKYLEEIKKNS